jgi:hypothetical protein
MFQRFYEDASPEQCSQFAANISQSGAEFSPAQIQGHLLLHKVRVLVIMCKLYCFRNDPMMP